MRIFRIMLDPEHELWIYLVMGTLIGGLVTMLYVNLFM